MRRLSTSGPLILISTPSESFQQFSDEWEKGNPDSPDRVPYHMSVRMSTRENIGYGITQEAFDRVVRSMPKHLVPQNIDGHFIEARNAFFNAAAVEEMFDPGLPERVPSTANHRYVQGVDPAMSHDATWSIVLDYTAGERVMGVSGFKREGKQSLPKLVALISEQHLAYSEGTAACMTAVDTSGMGGKVFRDALSHLHPLRPVEFGGVRSRKLKLLVDLKGYIERGVLRFPKHGLWLELRKQLLGYRLDDKGLKTDAVMALAVAVKQLVSGAAAVASSVDALAFDFSDEAGGATGVDAFPKKGRPRDLRSVDYTDAATPGEVGARIRAGANFSRAF